jgi:hypothetical protein
MRNAVKSRLATDAAKRAPRQELIDYLAAPLEEVDDIVAWWGVRICVRNFLYWILTYHFTAAFYAVSHSR